MMQIDCGLVSIEDRQLKVVDFSTFNVADALKVIKTDIMKGIRRTNRGCSVADIVFYFSKNFSQNLIQRAILITGYLVNYYRTGELVVYDYVGKNYDPVERRIRESIVTEANL